MINKIEPLVSICCITYNQKKIIKDAINSFLVQKTDFPIEILIHDDASTDGTAEIVRVYENKYPDLIDVVYQTENQYSKGKRVFYNLFNIARGKYIALCEGDDYWTDPLKLQKQVDFLESHPECSLCCHKVIIHFGDGEFPDSVSPKFNGNRILNKKEFFIFTCSVMFRNIIPEEYYSYISDFKVGDTPLWHYLAQFGNVAFLDQCMATYRRHKAGVFGSLSQIDQVLCMIDTREKITRKLGYQENHFNLILYHIKLIKLHRHMENYNGMRNQIQKCYPYLKYASARQIFAVFKYSLISIFPFIDKLYKLFKT